MPAFISVDGAAFRSTMQTVLGQMEQYGKACAAAVTIAQVEYAEKLLNEMKQNITHGGRIPRIPTYMLAQSGHVDGPKRLGDFTVVEIVWDAPYADIQDKGGTIFPADVNAAFANNRQVFSRGNKAPIRGALGRYITRKRLNTARLFVPLRPGVVPIQDPAERAAMGYVWGVDYVLARSVTITGSEFISKVLRKSVPNADRDIGARAEVIIDGLMAAI